MIPLLEKIFAVRQMNAIFQIWPAIREMFSGVGLKRIGLLILAIFEMFGVILFDTPRTPYGPELDLSGYTLVFEDEFNGNALDLNEWDYRSTGRRAGGIVYPDQVRVEDGKLIIKAEYLKDGAYGEGWYTGMISTKKEYVQGYFEMKCIVSKGGGFWSAWWLNSRGMASAEASNGGLGGAEIDIFEAPNYKESFGKNSVTHAVHIGGYGDGLRSERHGSWNVKSDIYKEYNTYGVLWTDTEYIFYINGVESVRSKFEKGVSAFPEYGIISLEPPSANELTDDTAFSTEFVVESIKIWQKA